MDPQLYSDILEYKNNATYPDGFTRNDKTNFRRKANTFDVQDGKLFYKKKGNPIEVVCGSEKAAEIFKDFHASSIGAHCGQKRTRDAISKTFYWPGMTDDIDTWVAQCMECQASGIQIKEETTYTPIIVNQPFELIGMDLIGKLTTTKNGNSYICVMIDYLTKWPQAYPLQSKRAEEVADCILNFFYQFEAPKRILTDQGKEFVNAINTNICKILGIERSLCAPYHPQTNGLVEKMNGTIQRALRKLVGERPDTWDQHLNAVMFGLRTKKQVTTKFSPFFLMFGREARYPSQVPEEFMIDSSVEDIVESESPTDDVLKLSDALLAARDNIATANQNIRKSKSQPSKFKVGDRVWRLNVRSQQRKGGKLDPDYLGPFTITSLQDKSADLQNLEGRVFPKISVDHLKKHVEPKPLIPHKILNSSASSASTTSVTSSSSSAPASTTSATSSSSSAPASTTSATSSSSSAPASTTSVPVSTTAAASVPGSTTAPVSTAAPPTCSSLSASAAINKYVMDAWAGKDVYTLLAKVGPYKLFFQDIARTAPNKELESEVINAYMELMVRQYNQQNKDKAVVIDTFALTDIWNGKDTLQKLDPMMYKWIIGIVHQGGHWMLVVMKPLQRTCMFLDPLGESQTKMRRCQVMTRAFMRRREINIRKWPCTTLNHPTQTDTTSCGVFALKFAECILKGQSVSFGTTARDIEGLRKHIAITILENSDDLSQICRICGFEDEENENEEEDNQDDTVSWIACDVCQWWYHQRCVNWSSTDSNYTCASCK